MGTCMASLLVMVVVENGKLGEGQGTCAPVVVESGTLGEDGVEEEEEIGKVVEERNKCICLLKFHMGN